MITRVHTREGGGSESEGKRGDHKVELRVMALPEEGQEPRHVAMGSRIWKRHFCLEPSKGLKPFYFRLPNSRPVR